MADRVVVLVLGEDGLIHEGVLKMRDDLEACTMRVAARRVTIAEVERMPDRMCPRCFEEVK